MKLFFTLLFTSTTLVASAQATKPAATRRQTPTMLGLGPLKINTSTTAVIDELCKELKVKLRYANSQAALRELTSDSIAVFSIVYRPDNEPSEEIEQAQPCSSSKVYYLPYYEVAGLPVRGMYLTFLNNLLIKIELPEPGRIPEAFTVKYGKPSQQIKYTKATCIYTHTGNKIDYKNSLLTEAWYNGSVSATNVINSYYDSNCNKQITTSFTVENAAKEYQMSRCSEAVVNARQASKNKEARKGLSDL